MNRLAGVVSIAALLIAAGLEPRWRALNHAAAQAIKAKNYSELRETLRELKPLLPGNPTVLYNLAAADARLGDPTAALNGLRNLARAGLIYDFASDPDFASLRAAPGFKAVIEQVNQNKRPTSHSKFAFALTTPDLVPEDMLTTLRPAAS